MGNHPKKGRPSFDIKEDPEVDAEVSAHVLHPNRNTQKKREQQLSKQEEKEAATDAHNSFVAEEQAPVQELPYRLDKTALVSLARQSAGRCVSVYLPVHKGGLAVNELNDAVLFKDCIREAAVQLQQTGLSEPRAQKILAPAYALIDNDDFWRDQLQGLAFFATEGFCRYIRLPQSPKQQVLVNDHFLLSPLIPFLTGSQHFFVLSLSKHQASLFRADGFGMTPIPLADMPHGMKDVVHFEEKDQAGVFRAGSSGAGGGANYHGVGGNKPDEKESIALYLAEVARTIEKEVLAQEHAPLLLAGVDYLHPIYISVAHYKPIIQEGLKGSYEHVPMPELYRQAREKLQPLLDAEEQRFIDEYKNKSGGALTSSIPDDVIPAAYYGQAGRLFVQQDAQLWGHFDPQAQSLVIHDEKQAGDDNLVDVAAIQVLNNGGYVHILPKERMPGESVMAALLRYP